MAIELTDELIDLQRACNAAREECTVLPYSAERWRPWTDAANALHAAVTAHVAATGQSWFEVGQAVKQAAKVPSDV